MGKRDARYQLSKDFEIDEAFFETVDFEYIKRKNDEPFMDITGHVQRATFLKYVKVGVEQKAVEFVNAKNGDSHK